MCPGLAAVSSRSTFKLARLELSGSGDDQHRADEQQTVLVICDGGKGEPKVRSHQ